MAHRSAIPFFQCPRRLGRRLGQPKGHGDEGLLELLDLPPGRDEIGDSAAA
jgi:hypothetical protein